MPDLAPAYAEIFLLVHGVRDPDRRSVHLRRQPRSATYLLTQATLAGCIIITYATWRIEPAYTFSGMFVDDVMSDVLKLLIFGGAMVALVYSRAYIAARGLFRGEFFVLALFATLGMMVMISASHLLTLYLGLELLSLSLYAMVALQRDSAVATEAAMKYFVLGALASGMLLYGMSMIYGATGTLEITRLGGSRFEGERTGCGAWCSAWSSSSPASGFKLGAVPFHMWVPDVYHGAPTAVTLFIGSAPKLAAFAFVMRLLVQGLDAGSWSTTGSRC